MDNDFDEMVEWSKTNGINNHDHAGASRIRDKFDCSWSVAEEVASVARGEEDKPPVNADQDNVIELIRKNVPDGLNDVDEFITELQSWSETLQSMEVERSLAQLDIKTNKPILLVTIADVHFGNIQTDIGRLMEHMDMIRERPYVFTLLDGDLTEGGILKSMMDLVLEQVITPKNQRKIMWSLMEKICPNLLAVITGQHDDWPSKTADFEWLEWFSDEHDISYLGWGGKIELNVGEQPWDILARHRYRFNSSQNATHCFPPETELMTNGGLKPISNLQKGDTVINHYGNWDRVTNVYKQNYNGPWIELEIQSAKNIESTNYHPYYVVTKESLSCPYKSRKQYTCWQRCRNDCHVRRKPINNVTPQWVKAEDIQEGDFLVIPRHHGEMHVGNNFAFICGVYAAEGSLMTNPTAVDRLTGLQFALGSHEVKFIEEIKENLERLSDYKVTAHYYDTSCSITVSDRNLARRIKTVISGEAAHTKNLYSHVREWDDIAKKEFLRGYILGDGCISKNGKDERASTLKDIDQIRSNTVSKNLAQWITLLSADLGFYNGYKQHPHCDSAKGDRDYYLNAAYGKNCIYGMEVIFDKHIQNQSRSGTRITDNYVLVPVTSVNEKFYEGEIWNAEIETDESFSVGSFAVHNSPKKMMKEGPWGFGDVAIVADKHEYAYECCELGGQPCAVMRPGSYKQTDDYCSKGGYNPSRPFMPGVILWPDRRLFHGSADFRMLLPMIDAIYDDTVDYAMFPDWDKERGKISC